MSPRWEWADSSSASAHRQRVAGHITYNLVQDAYRAFMDHSLHCDDCEYGEIRCATAKGLWRVYVSAKSPSSRG